MTSLLTLILLAQGASQHTIPASETPLKGLALVKGIRTRPKVTQFATFSGGCFWGVEQEFRKEKGVVATMVGYSGGHVRNVNYKDVCTDTTGHAESVVIEFDPTRTTYSALVRAFFDIHNPTTLNRQGPDVGEQYRSVAFYRNENQRQVLVKTIAAYNKSNEFGAPIVTEVQPVQAFYRAEEYHQQYVEKGGLAVCHGRRSHR